MFSKFYHKLNLISQFKAAQKGVYSFVGITCMSWCPLRNFIFSSKNYEERNLIFLFGWQLSISLLGDKYIGPTQFCIVRSYIHSRVALHCSVDISTRAIRGWDELMLQLFDHHNVDQEQSNKRTGRPISPTEEHMAYIV